MTRAEILERARVCVCGERETDYGSPEDNFKRIADLWSAYTGHNYSALDVAMMMALLKLARIRAGGTDDSFVDLAGYAACGGEIFGGKKACHWIKQSATEKNTESHTEEQKPSTSDAETMATANGATETGPIALEKQP